MNFKQKVVDYLESNGVTVNRTEQDGEFSVVCHVPQSDNIKIANMKDRLETVLNAVMLQSDSYGMNVVIVESNELDEE